MSRKRRGDDLVFTNYYAPHLNGGRGFANNPTNNRQYLTQNMYVRVLTELCANRFKWVGLPDTIDERFLELELFRSALAVFYWDVDFERYLAVRASGAGQTNMYDNPTSFTIYTPKFNKQLGPKNCVPIWANYLRTPDHDIVQLFAQRLAAIDRTIDINVSNMRFSKVVTAEENERQSWVNIIRQHDEGMPVIFGTQALDMSKVMAFDVSVHHEALPNLLIARTKMWNDCMTLLGINNANQDKKERLVADEVSANDEQVNAAKSIALNARRQACAQINRMYDLAVSVDFNTKLELPSYAQGII